MGYSKYGQDMDTAGLLFGDWCDTWLRLGKRRLKESTYIKYSGFLRHYIQPELGWYTPDAITTERLDSFTTFLLHENRLSAKTTRDILVVLHAILRYTARQCALPPVDIIYPREVKKEMRVLSREEQERLVTYLRTDLDPCYFGILLALGTGLRIGEICALRWDHISLHDQWIWIDATLQRLQKAEPDDTGKKTRLVIGPPKSSTSVRRIPLTPTMVELCRQMQPADQTAYVLTGTTRCMEPRTVQYHLKKITEACDLPGVHFHTLRHTFATRCVEVGFEIKSLSEILGHANTTITLERYVHASMELKRSNMNKLTAAGL